MGLVEDRGELIAVDRDDLQPVRPARGDVADPLADLGRACPSGPC